MHIFGYVRVSTREQAMKGYSLDEQERRIRDYANLYYGSEALGIEIIRDGGESAKNLRRSGMNRLIAEMKAGNVDILIIHNLDRLTRRIRDLMTLLDLFEETGTELVSVKDGIDTATSMGRFFIYIIILIAQWEQDVIAERTVRGLQESARQGNYSKSKVPFGYLRDSEDYGKLIPDPEMSLVVQEIFEGIADDKETAHSAACKLRNKEITDRKWDYKDIVRIIRNKAYIGVYELQGQQYQEQIPALITEEVWNLANEKVVKRDHKVYSYLFRDMVVCETCHSKMKQDAGTGYGGKVYLYYTCPVCRRRINEKKIIDAVKDNLSYTYRQDEDAAAYSNLLTSLRICRSAHKHLIEDLQTSGMSAENFLREEKIYRDRIISIEAQLQEMQNHIYRESFIELSQEKKQELITAYIQYVEIVFPDEVKVHYNEAYRKAAENEAKIGKSYRIRERIDERSGGKRI